MPQRCACARRRLPADGKITQAAFVEACKADVYAVPKLDPGAPLKGANSFTEGQAKDRAIAWGCHQRLRLSPRMPTASGAAPP